MTRKDLSLALQHVAHALVESDIAQILDTVFTRDGVEPQGSLDAFQKYSRLSHLFSENEKKVVKIFHLDELEKASFWQSIILNDTEIYGLLSTVKDQVKLVIEYVPNILKLIEQEGISIIPGNRNQPQFLQGKELLTTILPEDDRKFSSPQRLVNVIESIELLYSVCASLEGLPENDLAVIAIDSGSDKSFDFIGAAKIVECVKDTIIALWDRVVFYREKKQVERLDLIEKSLPLVERINRLEKEETLSSEQAEIFRRNVFAGIHKFAASGAIIPELKTVSSFNPRKLMAPEPKLLVEKTSIEPEAKSGNESGKVGKQNLSSDEMKKLKDLLNKMENDEDA